MFVIDDGLGSMATGVERQAKHYRRQLFTKQCHTISAVEVPSGDWVNSIKDPKAEQAIPRTGLLSQLQL